MWVRGTGRSQADAEADAWATAGMIENGHRMADALAGPLARFESWLVISFGVPIVRVFVWFTMLVYAPMFRPWAAAVAYCLHLMVWFAGPSLRGTAFDLAPGSPDALRNQVLLIAVIGIPAGLLAKLPERLIEGPIVARLFGRYRAGAAPLIVLAYAAFGFVREAWPRQWASTHSLSTLAFYVALTFIASAYGVYYRSVQFPGLKRF